MTMELRDSATARVLARSAQYGSAEPATRNEVVVLFLVAEKATVDIVDAKKLQLVWEAVGVGRVTEEALENLEQSVKEGVPRFFAGYPFIAGNPTPVGDEKG